MTLLALIIALLLEQLRALPVERVVLAPLRTLSASVLDRFDDESSRTAYAVWITLVLGASAVSAYAFFVLSAIHPALGLLFNIAALYLTMGFRQESHFFSDMHLALSMGEVEQARSLLSEWSGQPHSAAGECELSRLAIERALVAAHRTVFGVSFWFVLLPGPSGAILYRLARFFADHWSRNRSSSGQGFGAVAKQALEWLDWLPVRLTALGFSVAGNFEDALLCWRGQARQWHPQAEGILIASGAGAMGVRLGLPVHGGGAEVERPEMGTGEEASAGFMQSTIGLVWRTLVLCLLLLALLGIAGWAGS